MAEKATIHSMAHTAMGKKREYKMRDLTVTTARRHERNANDVLYHKCSPIVILSK